MNEVFLKCFGLLMICVLLTGCGKGGKIDVFTAIEDHSELPFSNWVKGEPEPTGFDTELVKLVCREMGVEPRFHQLNTRRQWIDIRRELLEEKRVHLVAYAYTVTDERKKYVAFSNPYHESKMGALVRAESGIETIDQVKQAKVFAPNYTTGYAWAKQQVTEDGEIMGELPQAYRGTVEEFILEGGADVWLSDYATLSTIAARNSDLKLVTEPVASEPLAIAVTKDNVSLLNRVNKALAALETSGELPALRSRYFGK